MGAIGGLLGTAGGANGTGYKTPQQANIQAGTGAGAAQGAQAGATQSLSGQNALMAALQQGGAQNQANTLASSNSLMGGLNAVNGPGLQLGAAGQQGQLNAGLSGVNGTGVMQNAINQQGGLSNNLGSANGVGAQVGAIGALGNVYNQQQGIANQYQNIANGTGPNPAQAALNQSTGQNIANQASLMAGQRGAGSNVGLMARQSAQQGAALQQQAVGQAATLQAQQQIAGLQGMGSSVGAMGNTGAQIGALGSGLTAQQQAAINAGYGQGAGVTGQLQTGIGQQFGQGATTTGQVQNQLGLNAGIAQNQVENQMAATGANTQANMTNAGQIYSALGNQNNAGVSSQGSVNAGNTSLANTGMQGQQALIGGIMNGAGEASSAAGARGGYVRMAEGGMPDPMTVPNGTGGPVVSAPAAPAPPMAAAAPMPGPVSSFGQYLSGATDTGQFLGASAAPIESTPQDKTPITATEIQAPPQMGYGSQMLYQGASSGTKAALKAAGMAAMAGARGGETRDLRSGGKVPAGSPKEKAVAKGNSYSNDKIPAMLSEGEVVIPRSVMQSADPVRSSADFVAKVMAKRGRK